MAKISSSTSSYNNNGNDAGLSKSGNSLTVASKLGKTKAIQSLGKKIVTRNNNSSNQSEQKRRGRPPKAKTITAESIFSSLEQRRLALVSKNLEVRDLRCLIASDCAQFIDAMNGDTKSIKEFIEQRGFKWPEANAVLPAELGLIRLFMFSDSDPTDKNTKPRISEWARVVAVLNRMKLFGQDAIAFVRKEGGVKGICARYDNTGQPNVMNKSDDSGFPDKSQSSNGVNRYSSYINALEEQLSIAKSKNDELPEQNTRVRMIELHMLLFKKLQEGSVLGKGKINVSDDLKDGALSKDEGGFELFIVHRTGVKFDVIYNVSQPLEKMVSLIDPSFK